MVTKKNINVRLLWIALTALLTLFFVGFQFLHTETDLRGGETCPICIFGKTTPLSGVAFSILLLFAGLLIAGTQVYLDRKPLHLFFISHILGQRAPPLS